MKSDTPFESILTAGEKRELRAAVFRDQSLVGVDLSGADFRGARFERVQFEACDLTGADLRGAHFVRCVFRSVLMTSARLGGNRFDGSVLIQIVGLSEEDRLWIEHEGGTFRHLHANFH